MDTDFLEQRAEAIPLDVAFSGIQKPILKAQFQEETLRGLIIQGLVALCVIFLCIVVR